MGAMFRSEEMVLCQMFIQPEAAYAELSALGEAGTVQFRDAQKNLEWKACYAEKADSTLNEGVNAFQRRFVGEVRRADEMERKLRFIEAEMTKEGIEIPELTALPPAPHSSEISGLENQVDKTHREISELSQNATVLRISYIGLTELKYVLEKTEMFFEEAISVEPAPNRYEDGRGKLEFAAGVIRRERVPAFERMLWRVSRGNVYLRRSDLDRPLENARSGVKRAMNVFVVFFQGERLMTRVKKICAGFHATLYPCPPCHKEREMNLKAVNLRLNDLEMVLSRTREHRLKVLYDIAGDVPHWHIKAKKMKAIYHTLNLFDMDVSNKCLVGECWIPTADLPAVQKTLIESARVSGSRIPSFLNVISTSDTPPTFNRTNRFTKGFQNLIDAYGISTYREANPALYTIITFPFLFAVMFGDLGHGFIIALFGGYMVIYENKLAKIKTSNEIWNIFFAGRYIILLMGLFSMYTGIVYNDLFSKAVNLFGSSWKNEYDTGTLNMDHAHMMDPKVSYSDEPYPLGIDPVWQLAENKIIFMNSYKMKLSIIFGVMHMIFGVCMSVVNYNYFRRRYSIWLEFLPQVLFLMLLFLYMVFMMFFKWYTYSCSTKVVKKRENCAPSVLIMFIDMMLWNKPVKVPGCDDYMFDSQKTLQKVLVVVALVCVPIMLLGKPLYILRRQRRKTKALKVKPSKESKKKKQDKKKKQGEVETDTDQEDKNKESVLEMVKPQKDNKKKKQKKKKKKEEMESVTDEGETYKESVIEMIKPPKDSKKKKQKKKQKQGEMQSNTDTEEESVPEMSERGDREARGSESKPATSAPGATEEDEPMSEIMMHQGIHTIEYVLGTVSHTASYLRLWALSLAHGELSDVLWNMVLRIGLKTENSAASAILFFTFFLWATFTLAILVLMEGLSAFLHTLRLHWVEFMSKFFGGLGYKFEPFSFSAIFEHEEQEETKD